MTQALNELTSALTAAVDENEKQNVVNEFLTGTDETKKQEVIQALANPSSENVNDAVKTLETILGTKPSESQTEEEKKTAEVAKSAAVLAVLLSENENISDETKGELFNTYLNTEKQQSGNSQSIDGYVNAAEGLTGASAQEAAQVLYLAMQANSSQRDSKIKSVLEPVDNGNGTYTINLRKNDGPRTVHVLTDRNGNIQVDYNSKAH